MTKKLILAFAFILLLAFSASAGYLLGRNSHRYETKVAGEYLYKIDRDTGTTEFCAGPVCRIATNTPAPSADSVQWELQRAEGNAKTHNEERRRCEGLLMLEEGYITSDGKWTQKARRAYQTESKRNAALAGLATISLGSRIRDARLISRGADPRTFTIPLSELLKY